MSATTSRLFQYSKCDPMLMPKILLRYCFWQGSIWRLSKRKRKILHAYLLSYFPCFGYDLLHFAMLLLTQSAPKTRILSPITHSSRFGAKSEIYYSSVTIHCYYSSVTIHLLLFTPNFCLFKGVVPYISSKFLVCLVQDFFPRESYPLWAFLWEISLLTITSLLSLQSL